MIVNVVADSQRSGEAPRRFRASTVRLPCLRPCPCPPARLSNSGKSRSVRKGIPADFCHGPCRSNPSHLGAGTGHGACVFGTWVWMDSAS